MRHINNSVLKGTLRLKILWTWTKIRANSFIKTLLNNMKRKIKKCFEHYHLRQNATPQFKEHCTKIDISLVVTRFFFSQTKQIFKYNSLFIDILDSFCHSLFTCLAFDFYILRILKFIQCLYTFFIKTSKILIRFNVLFVRFLSPKYCHVMSYFP